MSQYLLYADMTEIVLRSLTSTERGPVTPSPITATGSGGGSNEYMV